MSATATSAETNGTKTTHASDAPAQPTKSASPKSLAATLSAMKASHHKAGAPDYETRINHLNALEKMLISKQDRICDAIDKDFGGRSRHESLVAEIYLTVTGIRHIREHLHDWMATEDREVAWTFLPGRAEVMSQPLGVVGVISPWNYPIQLALAPLAAALAAGNRAMLKPSELVPETSEVLRQMIADTFTPDHVTVVTGGSDVAEEFSKLAFDHLLFTGSIRVGKAVMRAAAENLTPVTLELGGKSPAIVGEAFPIDVAADRIVSGKLFNAGQTCIAPDYVLLPEAKVDAFVAQAKRAMAKLYPVLSGNSDYTAIVNDRHHQRLAGYLSDATAKGAKVIPLSDESLSDSSRKMMPTIVVDAPEDSLIMQEEIFGPLLPIKTYSTMGEAIAYINDHPRPLALYCFDYDSVNVSRVLRETISGGVTVNDTMLQFAQDDLPFGGVGASGMGHYHGREGFETFSKKKPIFYQARVNAVSALRPPFGKALDFFLKMMLRK